MRLENVLALTHGSLMSQPYVSLFGDIVIEASRVKRGSLFVALNIHDIALAIDNGAYGIVYDRDIEFDDNETAWIKVDDSYDALKRMIRFILIDKELDAFTCKDVSLQVAKQLITPDSFIILEGNLSDNFSKLLLAEKNTTVIFVDTEIQSDLFTEVKTLDKKVKNKIQIVEQTLFESAFIYDGIFYERQSISAFFIPYLEQILNLLSRKNINFKIKTNIDISHFRAQFVNKSLHVRDFGSTSKVIIFEDDLTLVEKQIEFILKHSPWAKFFCLAPDSCDLKNKNIIYYNSKKDALKILKENSFNFVLAVKLESDILENLDNHPMQHTLF